MTEPSDVILEIHCPHHLYQSLRAQGKEFVSIDPLLSTSPGPPP